ncbi:dynein light chain Tctex-type protein 2B-like [Phymastichus coffea]|uniref:dynein light chain Tctex-type protein 2B-like n=1 Tax=Phymastichus coffea TaxID=108790 RepID=UPI00273AC0EF|nr:dynein light chain Tctex-type protein 2B-like [Phymastichus coffea]XP_058802351.1 dynein light chain Tctex-type protein 2B-like [Phymastichus coffea]XP_058802352.1 dynein light chain Tctex-type protein 2B-like [Phymastichus coffea]XP_058802353.1 dynein light chain Tctex-type protein 2B-like [Phymastichus coffea]XP_058802354.1 dynein light chain Tctex-type protein 2B-like [Phymastichus coffea]
MENLPESRSNSKQEDDSPENIDNAESESAKYQIRPKLEEKFKPMLAKEVIHNVLYDRLSNKEYDREQAPNWAKEIADIIREKMKKLEFKRYKYVVSVVVGSREGAGVKVGTRCIWDAEADCYAYDSFLNDTIFCVTAVYAIYVY